MKKFNCNIISDDYLGVIHVNQDVQKDEDDNFLDIQMYDSNNRSNVGVTLSLEDTKRLIEELQEYVRDNECIE